MALHEIRKSAASRWWAVLIPACGFVALSFSVSIYAGSVALGVTIVIACMLAPVLREFVAQPPVALVIADNGLQLTHRFIPWVDIEHASLSYGGRRGTLLCLRLREPEKYLGTLERANLALSTFHVFVPVGELAYTPEKILGLVQQANRAHA
jgi:hypothetical protein